MRPHLIVIAGLILSLSFPSPLSAAVDDEPASVAGHDVRLIAPANVRLEVDGVRFAGPLEVGSGSTGLGLTERTTLDGYLEGIAEVPFDWPREALRAQAVAARTYLAWTLSRGRTSSGRRYGYDICATTACQVYTGVGVVEGWGGDRWREAVQSTSDEILTYGGSPAQALYSSTSGGRTRSVEDVFPGAAPSPYLNAVESPDEDSPFVDWEFTLTQQEMALLLSEAGLLRGGLIDVSTATTEDGDGSWVVLIEGTDGDTRIGTWELRTELNAAADAALSDRLPVMRPDVDRRYPQTILSPTFTIRSEGQFMLPVNGPPLIQTIYRVRGNGWGHLVGMSQFGAEAMASRGSGYPEILSHYYGGLTPAVSLALPNDVVVGLKAGVTDFEVRADGPIRVEVDGEMVADGVLGTWRFEQAGDGVRVLPPVGLGLSPTLERVEIRTAGRTPVLLEVWLTTAAEVRVSERVGGILVPRSDWAIHDAGPVRWTWRDVMPLRTAVGGVLVIEARSPEGDAAVTVAYIPGAE